MKWIYYKHAMTAMALEALMVHEHSTTWRDPTDPLYMFLWNGLVFAGIESLFFFLVLSPLFPHMPQPNCPYTFPDGFPPLFFFAVVIAYAVEDAIECPSSLRKRRLLSPSALLRWWLSGAAHGFLITHTLVICFPNQTHQAQRRPLDARFYPHPPLPPTIVGVSSSMRPSS